jgi:hypothetical protein
MPGARASLQQKIFSGSLLFPTIEGQCWLSINYLLPAIVASTRHHGMVGSELFEAQMSHDGAVPYGAIS